MLLKKSHNEHGVDSVTFMAQYRRRAWSAVSDFISDRNAPLQFRVDQANGYPATVGTCGLPPDEMAMQREGRDPFDEMADAFGWDIQTRKIEEHIFNLGLRCSRLAWLESQIDEARHDRAARVGAMTPEEQSYFRREVVRRKAEYEKRKADDERRARARGLHQ